MGDRKPKSKKVNTEATSSSSSSTSSCSSDDEADAQDLKPIKGYLDNRRELARQLFKSVKTEKIRMMLPQLLKHMNLNELEEWCASELYGMSEARILSIVNGQPMMDSSDTSETDDSGPSLEIISDTEEWLTDTDVSLKQDSSSLGEPRSKKVKKTKKKHTAGKKNELDKSGAKGKGNSSSIIPEANIKKEKDKEKPAAKEGESLLDLLELEMRARAIRALIRKEEDIIPSEATDKRLQMTASALRNTLNSAVSASLSNEKNLNGKFNLGASTTEDKSSLEEQNPKVKPGESVEDEDVVFVDAQPAPTIELLSSDNDEENENDSKKDKKKDAGSSHPTETGKSRHSKSDKIPEVASIHDNSTVSNERVVSIDKSADGPDKFKIVITSRVSESSNSPGKSSKTKKISVDRSEKNSAAGGGGENKKSSDKVYAETGQTVKGLFKKVKKKQHLRNKRKGITDKSTGDKSAVEKSSEVSSSVSNKIDNKSQNEAATVEAENRISASGEKSSTIKILDAKDIKLETMENREIVNEAPKAVKKEVPKKKTRPHVTPDEDRLDDFEEIIDLDNYSDDMEDMETNSDANVTEEGADSSREKTVREERRINLNSETSPTEQSESSETWATRYYQTDDVQNVIKESKIQSEIRKRLRERQRLSKLSSPKLNSPGDNATTLVLEKTEENVETKTTGSVQEYHALKNSTASSDDATGVAAQAKDIESKVRDGSDESSQLVAERK